MLLAIKKRKHDKEADSTPLSDDKFEPMLASSKNPVAVQEHESAGNGKSIAASPFLPQASSSQTDQMLEAQITHLSKEIEQLKLSNRKLEDERQYLRGLSLQ